MTNSIEEVFSSEVLFITGSNTTENHPVIGSFMKRAVKAGAKLIVADPRRIELANFADVFLQIKPGTNVAMCLGMMHHIYMNNLHHKEYIDQRTENFQKLKETIKSFTSQMAADICGIQEADLIKAAEIYSQGKPSAIYYAMGITQHSSGTDHVKALANLAMLTGNVGLEGGGVNPLRGQNNVQGACDLGGLPNVYPGYQKTLDDQARKKFEKLWHTKLPLNNGLTIPKMMDGAYNGDLKMLYIMGENPMISDPDLNHIEKAINTLDFLVVQDIFMTETAMKADLVLPAKCYAEKEGTFTNTERRVQRVRQAVNPPGEAKDDWLIFKELMNTLDYHETLSSPEEIFQEISLCTPQYAGINYKRIETHGIQWPCPDESHQGTKYLHKDQFVKGLGTFHDLEYKEAKETVDQEYDLILTTGRVLYHYHTRTMTGKEEGLNKQVSESYIEISPKTAKLLDIKNNDYVRVASRRGEIEVLAKVVDTIPDKVVFIPFHFAKGAANRLTHAALDPITDIPEYKVCAVKVERL